MIIRGYSQIIIFSLVQLILCSNALKCMEGLNEVDDDCCYPCDPGYKVQWKCSATNGTRCVPCDPGTYSSQKSVRKQCLSCKLCDPVLGLEIRWDCSNISNTVCRCSPGYFCVDMKGDDCEMCKPLCLPGYYFKSLGSDRTICEKCQMGTFSPNGTLDQCLLWTNCTAQGLFEEKPGTDTTDTVCSQDNGSQSKNIISTTICMIFGVAVAVTVAIIVCSYQRGKRTHRKICDCFKANESGTKMPKEETRQEESISLKEGVSKSQDIWELDVTGSTVKPQDQVILSVFT